MPLQRYQDWPERLEAFFREAQDKPFARGAWDCALFAVAGCIAITGQDFGADFRGLYETREEADAMIEEGGHADLVALANDVLGAPLAAVMLAQRGDVVAFSTPEGYALGIVDLTGMKFAAVSLDKGLVRRPLRIASMAWRL